MGLFTKLEHFIGHVAKAGLDVVTGNPTAAVGQLVQSTGLIPSGGGAAQGQPKLVSRAYGTIPTANVQAANMAGLPVQVTNPIPMTTSQPPLQVTSPTGNFSGFLNWLKTQGAISDYISLLYTFITQPFSSWPTHLQTLYNQYKASLGTGTGGTGTGGTGTGLTIPGLNLSPVMQVQTHVVAKRAPKGYVTVHYNGQEVYMRKEIARSLHLYKARKKPPISVREWESAKSWQRVQKKIEKVAKDVDLKTEKRGRSRRTTTRRTPPRGEVQEAIIVK